MRQCEIVIADDARLQLRTIVQWWLENGAGKADLFRLEFEAAVERLRVLPEMGAPYRAVPGNRVRRLLLSKTGHYIYYSFNRSRSVVEILAIWHVARGSEPPL